MENNYHTKHAIRDWTLYVLMFSDGTYYIGITSYRNFLHRINQHGGTNGAKWNRSKIVEEIVEIQHLGKMSRLKAENIENDMFLEYRKKFGRNKVRGGYNIFSTSSIIPTYTPGSWQSIIFIGMCLIFALLALLFFVSISSHLFDFLV